MNRRPLVYVTAYPRRTACTIARAMIDGGFAAFRAEEQLSLGTAHEILRRADHVYTGHAGEESTAVKIARECAIPVWFPEDGPLEQFIKTVKGER